MNCAKVFFGYLKKNSRLNSSNCVGKHWKIVAFYHQKDKVKPCSRKIDMEDLNIPSNLHGMKVLDKNAFSYTITVPCLVITSSMRGSVVKFLKKYLLKIKGIKQITDPESDQLKILMDPKKINTWNDFDENTKQSLISEKVTDNNFSKVSVNLNYDNWSAEDLIKAVLPKDEPPLTSYSIIGHIIHLNIKDHLLDYKNVIGEILLDKVSSAKTVVYKKHFIDNVYRNFELEVICGEHNFITTVSENQCQFELDFSKVYWNPRLGTEHLRIVEIIKARDVLFDVFAGIGPFAIPAAKKGCSVFANDLNPESIKWLEHNITLNKKAKGYIKTFNKDGKDFILDVCYENFIKTWQDEFMTGQIHVVMNLPMIAPTFIKYFNKIIKSKDLKNLNVERVKKCLPIIHCYFFVKDKEDKKSHFEQVSEIKLDDIKHSFQFVRKVSGSSEMYRITFPLPFEYIVEGCNFDKIEPLPKRICL